MGLARTEYGLGHLDESLSTWKEARALSPDDPDISIGIAMVYIRRGDFEDSASELEKLASRENAPPSTFYYLGHSLMRLGRREEAKRAFEHFLDTWNGDEKLSDEVREILVTL